MIPIKYRNFKGAVDSTYFDAETSNVDIVAKTTNLTPFRKMGSLVQCPGFEEVISHEDLPNPVDYKLFDFFKFSVDRNNKEITILVYKKDSTGETKFYINPYYNPSINYDNSNSCSPSGQTVQYSSWVEEWVELTETYTITQSGAISGDTFTSSTAPSNFDSYFKGWFAVNTSIPTSDYNSNKFQYITGYNHTTKVFTCKSTPTGWSNGNTIKLYRFPCVYFYPTQIPVPTNLHYSSAGGKFKAIPTDFVQAENQVKIPCGKDLKPLLITMIFKKEYFKGKTTSNSSFSANYDGLWFDLEQIPQCLANSQVSAYRSSSSGGTGTSAYMTAVNPSWTAVAPANGILFQYFGTSSQKIVITDGTGVIPTGVEVSRESTTGDIVIWINSSLAVTLNDVISEIVTSGFLSSFTISLVGSGATLLSGTFPGWDVQTFSSGTSGSFGQDGGYNGQSNNLFLGTQVDVPLNPLYAADPMAVSPQHRVPFIMTAIYDNRNEVIISHGNMFSNVKYDPANTAPTHQTTSNASLQCRFNSWFSRRLTHIRLYTGEKEELTSDPEATILGLNSYPYFTWLKSVDINNTPLMNTYDISEFIKSKNGESIFNAEPIFDATIGMNSYTFDKTKSHYFVCFNDTYNKTSTKGEGFKFIVSCNRWIDQDITMNYTKGIFTGQINGRNFIIGCKNIIESEEFENDDYVMMSNYCAGVSSYNVFLRDRSLQINLGNKDSNVGLSFNRGKLVVIKNTNVFLVDINQRNEINYRIVDTVTGRGTSKADSICNTPYGTIICSSDTVWIVNSSGVNALLLNHNGRLKLYKDKFANKEVKCIYYNEYDELLIFSTDQTEREDNLSTTSYVLVYSFKSKFWTNYEYTDSVNPLIVRTDANHNIIILNKGEDYCNLIKLSEESNTFLDSEGTEYPILWEFETQAYSYADNKLDSVLEWVKTACDYITNENNSLKILFTFDNDQEGVTDYLTLNSSSNNLLKNILILLLINNILFQYLTINITNKNSSGDIQPFSYFSLNNLLLNINNLREKKTTNG